MIVTFDVYGTLFDWQNTMGAYLKYVGVDSKRFFEAEYSLVSNVKGFRRYSEILKQSLKECMGSVYSDDLGEGLVLAFAKSPPFPDVLLGLRELKRRGHRLGVISNTERQIIAVTLSGLEHFFDWVVTAEDTGHYKPARDAFTKAYASMGVKMGEVVHVSAYPQYDLETASGLGVKTILLDRYGYEWSTTTRDLRELAKTVDTNP
ncbi:MAG: HAD-IA family hydrolase [Thermoprotei archaeon]